MSVKKIVIKSSKVVKNRNQVPVKKKTTSLLPKTKTNALPQEKPPGAAIQSRERIQTAEGWRRAMLKKRAST